jgi:hypothetical protein
MPKPLAPVGDVLPSILELDQFWRYQGETYCFRPECGGCRWESTCRWEPAKVKVGPGLNVRRAFVAPTGWRYVCIDYSGIEMRLAAQLSQEQFWIKTFCEGDGDLHEALARKLFGTPTPTKAQRKLAKIGNFGCLYLGSPKALARQSGISEEESLFIYNGWWEAVPNYKAWTERQFRLAKEEGLVRTAFGRVRRLDRMIAAAVASEAAGRRGGKRGTWFHVQTTSINTPIQGTCADMLKVSLVRIDDWIEKNGLRDRVRLMLLVHDEIDLMIREGPDLPHLARTAADLMGLDLQWSVPITTDIDVGRNWADLVPLEAYEAELGLSSPAAPTPPRVRDELEIRVARSLPVEIKSAIVGLVSAASEGLGMKRRVFLATPTERLLLPRQVDEAVLRRSLATWPGVELVDAEDEVVS